MTKIVTLGEICKITSGGTPNTKKNEYFEGGHIPWVKTGDLKSKNLYSVDEYITDLGVKNSSAKLFPADTVLLAMYGATIGACSILRIPATTNQACAALLPSEKVLPDFLYYYLAKSKKELVNSGVGGAQPNISGHIIKNFPIHLPPLPEQRRIAALLDHADALRQKDRQLLAHYNKLAQSVFLDLFGDPVKNEKGWNIEKLENLVTEFKYGTNQKSDSIETSNAVPVIRIPNVLDNKVNYDDLKFADLSIQERKDTKLMKGDLLFVRSNGNPAYIGRCAVFEGDLECSYASYLIRAKLRQQAVVPEFAQFVIAFNTYRPIVLSKATTTAGNYNINTQALKSLPMPIPPLPLQTHFANVIEKIERQKAVVRQQMAASEGLFGRLLQESFG